MAVEFRRTQFAAGEMEELTAGKQKQEKKQKPHARKPSMGHP